VLLTVEVDELEAIPLEAIEAVDDEPDSPGTFRPPPRSPLWAATGKAIINTRTIVHIIRNIVLMRYLPANGGYGKQANLA
jgi:hypothetical protein